MKGRGARSSPLYGLRTRTLRACGYSACCPIVVITFGKGTRHAVSCCLAVEMIASSSQEEEVEDKVQ